MDDFARFFANSLDLYGIATAEGYFRRVNPTWERTLGWTADEVSARPWLEFVHPEDRESTIEAGRRLFAGESVVSFENRYRCKDGSYRLIQWHAETVDCEAYCSGRDVTDERRRVVLGARLDRADPLRKRGPWFFAIFDNAPFAMALTTLQEGVTVAVNDAFLALFEFGRGEVIGRTSINLGISDLESRARLAAEFRDRGAVRDFECVRRTKSGARVVLLLNVDPIHVEGETFVLTSVRDITRLTAATKDLRALVDNLPELAWTARPDGFIEFYNRRWYDYTGTKYEDMQGWGWQSVHDPNELPRVMESWTRSIATRQAFDQAFPLRRKDGVFRWFLTRVAPMFNDAGELIRWVGINTDIDDQRAAEQALRETQHQLEQRVRERTTALQASNERFHAVTETAHDAIVTVDINGIIVGWNTGAETLFGYAKDAACGMPLTALVPTRFHAAHLEGFANVRASGRLARAGKALELQALRRDGSEFPCELTLSSWKSGESVFVTGILRDITERQLAEEHVRRLAAIVESSDDAIYGYDLQGRIVSWNGGAERLFGYSAAEILGAHFHVLVPEDEQAEADAVISRTLGGEQLAHYETKRRRKDGSLADVFLTASAFRDLTGVTKGVSLIVRDITERKNIERKLLLADRMASVGTLAAGIAHEINNPLAYVTANLEVLVEELRALAGGSPSGKLRELIGIVNESREGAERVRKIVRGLKTFSRSDTEQRTPLQLSAVLDLAANMAFTEVRHRARLVKDYSSVPSVEADESRLTQVFINLIVNAAQSIGEGRADRNEIRLSTFVSASGRVVAEVKDSGAGIAPPLLKRIFDPFFTTKDIGVGTGLGLSICEGIVTALGGELTVGSEVGKGSTFRVSLPPLLGDGPSIGGALARRPSLKPPGKRGRVLVIDDEPALAVMLQRILSSDHDVFVTASGREALDHLAVDGAFDVIVCDLMMPVLTGMDVYEELQHIAPDLAARMIFITGGAFTPRAREFLDSVAIQWLEKPFDMQNLRAAVGNLAKLTT